MPILLSILLFRRILMSFQYCILFCLSRDGIFRYLCTWLDLSLQTSPVPANWPLVQHMWFVSEHFEPVTSAAAGQQGWSSMTKLLSHSYRHKASINFNSSSKLSTQISFYTLETVCYCLWTLTQLMQTCIVLHFIVCAIATIVCVVESTESTESTEVVSKFMCSYTNVTPNMVKGPAIQWYKTQHHSCVLRTHHLHQYERDQKHHARQPLKTGSIYLLDTRIKTLFYSFHTSVWKFC